MMIDGMYRVTWTRRGRVTRWWWMMLNTDCAEPWSGPFDSKAEALEDLRLFREGA